MQLSLWWDVHHTQMRGWPHAYFLVDGNLWDYRFTDDMYRRYLDGQRVQRCVRWFAELMFGREAPSASATAFGGRISGRVRSCQHIVVVRFDVTVFVLARSPILFVRSFLERWSTAWWIPCHRYNWLLLRVKEAVQNVDQFGTMFFLDSVQFGNDLCQTILRTCGWKSITMKLMKGYDKLCFDQGKVTFEWSEKNWKKMCCVLSSSPPRWPLMLSSRTLFRPTLAGR